MTAILKPTTIRKIEKFVAEWRTLDEELDKLEKMSDKLPDGPKWRKVRNEMTKMYMRQEECRSIVIRSLFKRK